MAQHPVLVISGPSLMRELTYANTLLGRTLDNVTPTAGLATLLTGSGWSTAAVDGGLANITARFDGVPLWKAIEELAKINNVHVREVIPRQIDYGAFGVASGVVVMNVEAIGPNIDLSTNVGIVQSVKVTSDGSSIINSIIPLGTGVGTNQFALGDQNSAGGSPKIWSTRAAPYTILTGTGPNGKAYYYIEDATSVAAYGRRQKVLASKQTLPVANSSAAFQNAANALYDLGATYLARYKDPLTIYDLTITKLDPGFKVGDTIRLIYHGVAEDSVTSRRLWLSVDQNLVVLDRTRIFNADGSYTWKLSVASLARWRLDDHAILIGALETLDIFRTGISHYTMSVSHGSERESIDATDNFDYSVVYDANVVIVLKCAVRVKLVALKSNVKVSAGGSSHSHTINSIALTADSSHSHNVNAATSQADSFNVVQSATDRHNHTMFTVGNSGSPNDGGYKEFFSGTNVKALFLGNSTSGTHYTTQAGNAALMIAAVSGSAHIHVLTPASIASTTQHTHAISSSALSTDTTHTHGLIYGIFRTSMAPTPALQVWINGTDRTVALGGPWTAAASPLTLDVTQYVTDAAGQPLRQDNLISFRTPSAIAFDIVAHASSLLSASAIGVQ